MLRQLILIACVLLGASLAAAPSAAQMGSLFGGTAPQSDSSTSDIDIILERAAEHGLGVIVINTDGTVLNAPTAASESPEAGQQGGGFGLMQVQANANTFREALIARVTALPDALMEVAELLRSKSPDGTIFAFMEVLIYSLGLFAVGMVAERQVFGKRIARRFIVSRILEAPQGYSEKMPFLAVRFFG